MTDLPALEVIAAQVRIALAEDVGSGDLSAGLIDTNIQKQAQIVCREHALLCGRAWADECFRQIDPDVELHWLAADGDPLDPGKPVCKLQGSAISLLAAERTALNFLQLLSGTATRAQQFARAVADLDVIPLDTRKTLPGLRAAQKYAVRCGGCRNHRMGLYDAVLLKENHLATDRIETLVKRARQRHRGVPVIVEVENLDELARAAASGADRALLDNFNIEDLQQAAREYRSQIELEASGNVTLAALRAIAETGVHYISIGTLTRDVQSCDFSMRFVAAG